jgi:hypothetical protein
MNGFKVRDVWESFDRKFNASDTRRGRNIAADEFAKAMLGSIENKKMGWRDVSFRGLHEGLVVAQDLQEDIDSSAFPNVLSKLISKKIIDAFDAYPKNGLNLVTVVPSSLKQELVVGWTSVGQISQVPEKDAYPQVTPPDEKFVKINNAKYGGLLDITEEVIKFDQTQQYLQRASMLGERGGQYQDKLILQGLIDKNSTVYNLGQLYKTDNSNSNYYSGASSALGTTGWQQAHFGLHSATDETGEPIWVSGDRPILMCAPNLVPTAMKLRQGDFGNIGTANLDVNVAQNMFDIVENIYIANPTTATDWYYGSFKRQFQWNEIFPLQVFSRSGQETDDGFKRDIVMQFKVRFYGGIGATETRYCVKNAGA